MPTMAYAASSRAFSASAGPHQTTTALRFIAAPSAASIVGWTSRGSCGRSGGTLERQYPPGTCQPKSVRRMSRRQLPWTQDHDPGFATKHSTLFCVESVYEVELLEPLI